jgi:hypothetical protein
MFVGVQKTDDEKEVDLMVKHCVVGSYFKWAKKMTKQKKMKNKKKKIQTNSLVSKKLVDMYSLICMCKWWLSLSDLEEVSFKTMPYSIKAKNTKTKHATTHVSIAVNELAKKDNHHLHIQINEYISTSFLETREFVWIFFFLFFIFFCFVIFFAHLKYEPTTQCLTIKSTSFSSSVFCTPTNIDFLHFYFYFVFFTSFFVFFCVCEFCCFDFKSSPRYFWNLKNFYCVVYKCH